MRCPGGEATAGRAPGRLVRERSWAGFKRFLAGCRTLGSLQEVPASVGTVVGSFGEVFDWFWEMSGR